MSPGSAASITSGVSSRSAARTNSVPPQSSKLSLNCGTHFRPSCVVAGPPGLFHEQHRDVVAHRVGQAAGLAGAHQLAGLLVGPERRVTLRAGQNVKEPAFNLHQIPLPFLTMPSTSSRRAAMAVSSSASTFRRSNGSVLDGRRLNHQSPAATVSPSRSSVLTPGRLAKACLTRAVASAWSATSELISPLAWYLAYSAISCESGLAWPPRAARACSAVSMPESANQKSLK